MPSAYDAIRQIRDRIGELENRQVAVARGERRPPVTPIIGRQALAASPEIIGVICHWDDTLPSGNARRMTLGVIPGHPPLVRYYSAMELGEGSIPPS